MHQRDVPIILTNLPPEKLYRTRKTLSEAEAQAMLESTASQIFRLLEVPSFSLMEPSLPNQDYIFFYRGIKNGFALEVRWGEGKNSRFYPFWIWVGPEPPGTYSDQSAEMAHAIAAKLTDEGWNCVVRGYSSAIA